MKEPKISVIVPVYKVEPYLRKCLDSIVGQTYRNLEIILVDDGSPDNCGAICDEYAAKDQRILVIHQPNGGLSAARNVGLDIATGECVGFVDSDDWVEPKMYGALLRGLETAGADIAICGRYEEYKDHRVAIEWPESQTMSREEALGELLKNERLQNLVWDKLYRRELFERIRFPEGKTFEDIAVMYRLFLRSEKVVCVPGAMYHYLQRPDSIVGDVSLKNKFARYEMLWQRYEDLKEDWPQFADLMIAQCRASAISLWAAYYANPEDVRKEYREKLRAVSAFARSHPETGAHTELGLAGRLVLRLVPFDSEWSFGLAWWVSKLYKLKHGRPL